MKTRSFKSLLALLLILCFVVLPMSIVASADDVAATSGDIETAYGVIPADKGVDPVATPFAIFEETATGVYTFLKADARWETSLSYVQGSVANNAVIVLLSDTTCTGNNFANMSLDVNDNILDLNGHTLIDKTANHAFFALRVFYEGSPVDSSLTVKNGTISLAQNALIQVLHHNDTAKENTSKLALNFENVTFSFTEGSAAPVILNLVLTSEAKNISISFDKCTIDYKNAPVNARFMRIGNGSSANFVTLTTTNTTQQTDNISFILDETVENNVLLGAPTAPNMVNNGAANQFNDTNELLDTIQVYNKLGDSYLSILPDNRAIGGNFTNAPWLYLENRDTDTTKSDARKLDEDSYYVIDFDVYTESDLLESMKMLIMNRSLPDGNGTQNRGADLVLGNFIKEINGWVHVTYVGDVANNKAHVFLDGEYAGTPGRAVANKALLETEDLYVIGLRIEVAAGANLQEGQMLGIRGISERVYTSNDAADDIAAALASGSLADWSNNIEGYQGTPDAIATVDGVEYYNVHAASAALNNDTEHDVVLLREFQGTIVTSDSVTLTPNGFGALDVNAQPVKDGNVMLGSNFYVDGNNYIELNAENYASYTKPTYWNAADNSISECIYFPYGAQISYVGEEFRVNYIEDGVIYNDVWEDADYNVITEFPTVQRDGNYEYFASENVATEATELTVNKGILLGMQLYSNYSIKLYVPVANGVVNAETTVKHGNVEYALYTIEIDANNVASDINYAIEFVVDGVTYTEKVKVSVLDYCEAILNSNYSNALKKVIMSALNYSNEAYALLNDGGDNAAIKALLDNAAYQGYKVEDFTDYGTLYTEALAGIVTGAALEVDSGVKVVLTVADDFRGEINVTANNFDGTTDTHTFNIEAGEDIVLPVKVFNLINDITVVAGENEGVYNVGGYIKYLVDNDAANAEFAQALFNYAKISEIYQKALLNV